MSNIKDVRFKLAVVAAMLGTSIQVLMMTMMIIIIIITMLLIIGRLIVYYEYAVLGLATLQAARDKL